MKLIELAKNVARELKNADEKYIIINGKKEKILTIEIVQITTVPRFQIVTEKGTVLILTPSQFLRKKYELIKNGEKKAFFGV
ncbi:SIFV_gp02-like protein [Sulfolobus islandicus filamentous virus 2]|uniref:SIFV_gp02-like protein n=1 Tax=Sulfolobus islandicus filamentous virus 2 TaxID=1902331 RepID=A0A1D8BJ55_SIFV|nr:SIFV_gp02-like protein [Sulfolobus islandicus filamentous virus 2]